MKKIFGLLAFVLIAVAVAVGAPKIIAPIHQEKLAEAITYIDNLPGYKATILSTKTNWFGSKNTIFIALDTEDYPSIKQKEIEIELDIDTAYGPIMFSNQGSLGLFESSARILGENQRDELIWDEDQPLYQISVLGGFTGDFKVTDTIPSFTNTEKTVDFSGYHGEGKINAKGYAYDGTLAKVDISTNAAIPVNIEGVHLSIETNTDLETLSKGGFYNGTMQFGLDSLNVANDTTMSDFTLLINMILNDETQLGSMQSVYKIKNFHYDEFQVSDLTLASELTNLSNQFFIDLTSFLQEESNLNNRTTNDAMLVFLQDNIDMLLAAQPEFNITDFSGTFPEGRFTSNLTSTLANIDTPKADDFMTKEFWLYNTIASANINIDEALLDNLAERFIANKARVSIDLPEVKQQAQIVIDGLVQQGFIKYENNQFTSHLGLENGEGKVNEVIFPLM